MDMTAKDFVRLIGRQKKDIIEVLLNILHKKQIPYCIIGGLAVNAYAEPVVSLDLDVIVATSNIKLLCQEMKKHRVKVEIFQHSINLTTQDSQLRIQIQTDKRYQSFVRNAVCKNVLGYKMMVAQLEDVLQGKIFAYQDKERRLSKKQKDLADIMRIVECYPNLLTQLPSSVRPLFENS
ncbi:hypothetical protein B9J78_00145 [bacterium Unc6]|nr:hypothetical protein [bacterium Unc6]